MRESEREAAVSEVAAEGVARVGPRGRVLVVGDIAGAVEGAVRASGGEVHRWRRLHRDDHQAAPWPGAGPFEAAYVRLPKGREALEMTLHAVGSRVEAGGRLWICGANDEGIKSVADRARSLFAQVDVVDARRHARLLEVTTPRLALRGALDDWAIRCEDALGDEPIAWWSFPGVFAHGRLDEGTRLLLDVLPDPPEGARVLDFACGAGLIGLAIARRSPGIRLDALDVDALALEAARRNLSMARRVLSSDAWSAIGDDTWDWIVSNPPLHAGKGSSFEAFDALIAQAPAHLRPNGTLWVVTQGTVALRDAMARHFGEVDSVARRGGFRVWAGRRPLRGPVRG